MDKNVFEIKEFNIIENEKNYYIFRDLNNSTYGRDTNEEEIILIRTNREEYEDEPKETDNRGGNKNNLEKVWEYIEQIFTKTTDNNSSVNYGQGYHKDNEQEYIVVKVPKKMEITSQKEQCKSTQAIEDEEKTELESEEPKDEIKKEEIVENKTVEEADNKEKIELQNQIEQEKEENIISNNEIDSEPEYNEYGIDKRGFDSDGYYYQKLEDGSYANTKLRYNRYGFRADGKHAITGTEIDLRNFDIDGKCKSNSDSVYDENGFKQDGTYKETGEKYHEGYNAFGVDKDGKMQNGDLDKDIIFTQDYIKAVMQNKRNEFIDSHFSTDTTNINEIMNEINLKIYRASEMYPLLRNKIAINMMSIKRAITQRIKDIEKMNAENNNNQAQMEKIQKEIEDLSQNMTYLDPNSSTREVENDKDKTTI